LPRLSGHSTAKIAAAVISANTNHSIIERVPVKRRKSLRRLAAALHHRRQVRAIDNYQFDKTSVKY
jgi:hypothetical protein